MMESNKNRVEFQLMSVESAEISAARRRIMRANVSKNTKPERQIRSFLYQEGYRYRLHYPKLPGKPDIVFPAKKKLIDVRGCFWHNHGCARHKRMPKARSEFWANKLHRNVERDQHNERLWSEAGWKCRIVWECEIKDNKSELEKQLVTFIQNS